MAKQKTKKISIRPLRTASWLEHHQITKELLNMETHGRSTSALSAQLTATGRRIILFPLPFQGHINPMLQLANILHSKGFKITIIHAEYNSPNYSNYPHFTFKSIPDGFSKISNLYSTNKNLNYFLSYLNESCVIPFRACLAELLAESDKEPVACLITDALCYFTQSVADNLKLPRLVLRTSSLSCTLIYTALPLFLEKGFFNLSKQEYEEPVSEFPLLKVKDIVKISSNPQGKSNIVTNMVKEMKASSGLIWNSCKELEQPALESICQEFPVPNFTIGPFHNYFSASSSSLLEQDRSIISWLDVQASKSVIYVSFGSFAIVSETEFQELAHGLANSGFPFLWVVRPGVVDGSERLESLLEKFLEVVGDRGRIVKWAPQQEVLAHPATGCFWTHTGWNSTLESICEGVPLICSPYFADQPINARYVTDEWKIGVMLENGFERVEIVKAIKRIMVDKEGEAIRKRIDYLKQKVNLSTDKGGSSNQSLENLVNYLFSL